MCFYLFYFYFHIFKFSPWQLWATIKIVFSVICILFNIIFPWSHNSACKLYPLKVSFSCNLWRSFRISLMFLSESLTNWTGSISISTCWLCYIFWERMQDGASGSCKRYLFQLSNYLCSNGNDLTSFKCQIRMKS